MDDMLEKLIMLQILKTMVYSKSEDQKHMLDTILDGANKAARTVANIRSIKEGKEPIALEPLAKEPTIENISNETNERNCMPPLESPTPPKAQSTSQYSTAPLESIYADVNVLRKKLDAMYETGLAGKNEINELIVETFTLQTKIFNMLKNK
jgi:hypothetical protein